jgi:hypothetical protein
MIADLEVWDIEATLILPLRMRRIDGGHFLASPLSDEAVKQLYGCASQHRRLCQDVQDAMYRRSVNSAFNLAQSFDAGKGFETKLTLSFDKGQIYLFDRKCRFSGLSDLPCLITDTLPISIIGDRNATLTSSIDVSARLAPPAGVSQATIALKPNYTPPLKAREILSKDADISICKQDVGYLHGSLTATEVADINSIGRRLPKNFTIDILFTVIDRSGGRATVTAHERQIPFRSQGFDPISNPRVGCATAHYIVSSYQS